MTLDEAFKKLVTQLWESQDNAYKAKYKSYRSKYLNPEGEGIGEKKKREMLQEAGAKEAWKLPLQKSTGHKGITATVNYIKE